MIENIRSETIETVIREVKETGELEELSRRPNTTLSPFDHEPETKIQAYTLLGREFESTQSYWQAARDYYSAATLLRTSGLELPARALFEKAGDMYAATVTHFGCQEAARCYMESRNHAKLAQFCNSDLISTLFDRGIDTPGSWKSHYLQLDAIHTREEDREIQ